MKERLNEETMTGTISHGDIHFAQNKRLNLIDDHLSCRVSTKIRYDFDLKEKYTPIIYVYISYYFNDFSL